MRRTIAALVAGIVLGATGVAAAAQAYWAESGSGYKCQGIGSGVTCDAGLYQVGITPNFVYIQHKRTKQTFGCRKRVAFSRCVKG